MKKITLILSLVLFSNIISKAQNADIVWTEKINNKKGIFLIGEHKKFFYIGYYKKNKEFIICKYNENMQLEKEQSIPIQSKNIQYIHEYSFFLKDKIIHILSSPKNKKNIQTLYSYATDFDLNSDGEMLVIDEGEHIGTGFSPDDRKRNTTDNELLNYDEGTTLSLDSSIFLIYKNRDFSKEEPARMNFKIYNENFSKKILDKDITFSNARKEMKVMDVRLNNNMNIYILAKITKKSQKKEIEENYYKLISITNNANETKELDLKFPNQKITSIEMDLSTDKILCVGFLSNIYDKNISDISDEWFTIKVNASNLTKISEKKIKTTKLYNSKKNENDYMQFFIKDIYNLSGEGYIILAEQYKSESYSNSYSDGSKTYFTSSGKQFHCDIAYIKIDVNGTTKSINKIPKYQYNLQNPSIMSTFYNNNVYIIYEDLSKNISGDYKDKKINLWNAADYGLFLVKISPEGEYKKELLFEYKKSRIQPNFRNSRKYSPNTILLSASDLLKSSNIIGKIKLK